MPLWIFSKASTPTAQAILAGTGPVLVDEFQDTDQAQYALLKLLAFFHRNIFLDRSIPQKL